MPIWTSGMTQTFEFYQVDPFSWKDAKKLETVTSATITRDVSNETIDTATIDATTRLSECYIRIYLVTIQNGYKERFCLGTFLIQTPRDKYNGSLHTFSYDAYSPLLELKDNMPPIGYFIPKNSNIMEAVNQLCFDNTRIPVIEGKGSDMLVEDFVAETSETWLSYIGALIANAKQNVRLDEQSRIIFSPEIDAEAMQPIWTYSDDNSSILYPDLDLQQDLYGIPNVFEVVYTNPNDTPIYVEVVNKDPDSLTSLKNRGRRVLKRETSPSVAGNPSEKELNEYGRKMLREASTLEYRVTYTHGYCPVRIGDCVLLNYNRAGLHNRKAKVISQSIKCEPGCPVEETAIFTIKMWEG